METIDRLLDEADALYNQIDERGANLARARLRYQIALRLAETDIYIPDDEIDAFVRRQEQKAGLLSN